MFQRRLRTAPFRRRIARFYSVLDPLPQLVDQLSVPAGLSGNVREWAGGTDRGAGSRSAAHLAAGDHHRGELLLPAVQRRAEEAFGLVNQSCRLGGDALALPCRYGRLHLNSDWFVLEPIDAEGRPQYHLAIGFALGDEPRELCAARDPLPARRQCGDLRLGMCVRVTTGDISVEGVPMRSCGFHVPGVMRRSCCRWRSPPWWKRPEVSAATRCCRPRQMPSLSVSITIRGPTEPTSGSGPRRTSRPATGPRCRRREVAAGGRIRRSTAAANRHVLQSLPVRE